MARVLWLGMHGCRTRLSLQESYAEVGEREAGEGLWTVRVQGFSTAGVQSPQYNLGGLSRRQINIRAKTVVLLTKKK